MLRIYADPSSGAQCVGYVQSYQQGRTSSWCLNIPVCLARAKTMQSIIIFVWSMISYSQPLTIYTLCVCAKIMQITVLQSKRVDFEYGVLSAVFTGQTCMSRVIIWYSVMSRVGLYISEIMDCNDLWCGLGMHKCTKIATVYVRHSF